VITNKYVAALLHVAFVLLGAILVDLKAGPISWSTIDQLGVFAVGTVVIVLVPLFSGHLHQELTVGAAILTTLGTAAAPFIAAGHFTTANIITVVLALLSTIGVGATASIHSAAKAKAAADSLVAPVTTSTVNNFGSSAPDNSAAPPVVAPASGTPPGGSTPEVTGN
jgi:hypothetical protein